ncbi:MAG: 16S rRNA (cytosine(1402)-N(4))-methyltransferase RsmH [Eubacterium sp.]|nr:16S rRNA (cytosine(1402)-N(4))-methyltransferase RsmH [Eubacterium sp.]
MDFNHVSVLLDETIEGLNINPDGIYFDGTLGGGGHSYEILKRLTGKGILIGVDQDGDAIDAASERLKEFEGKFQLVRSNYSEIETILNDLKISKIDGIVLDLGVSSYQIDNLERGFSYKEDAPLDMRMDQRQLLNAADVVNGYTEEQLIAMLRDYGEERYAKSIAKAILEGRKDKPIATTQELSEIVKNAVPKKYQIAKGHPAKKTFQAIRIEVNNELNVLRQTLDKMIEHLNPGGRICVITFHSLEDRIVKLNFRNNENPCTCPPDFPVCVCGKKSKGKVITRKPIVPSDEEVENNKRSKSSKLRIFERA